MAELKLKIITGPKACELCQGSCCKSLPGESMPAKWLKGGHLDHEKVVELLLTGKWAIDCWEGDPRQGYEGRYPELSDQIPTQVRAPYLRPSHSNSSLPFDYGWGGGGDCSFLTPSGCELSEIDRPDGCLNLQASIRVSEYEGEIGIEERDCYSSQGEYFKRMAAIAWIPYAGELLHAGNEAFSKID